MLFSVVMREIEKHTRFRDFFMSSSNLYFKNTQELQPNQIFTDIRWEKSVSNKVGVGQHQDVAVSGAAQQWQLINTKWQLVG